MINQIRADSYRLRRTLGIYLTFLVTIMYSILITGKKIIEGILVTGDSMAKLVSIKNWTIKDGINASTLSSSLLLFMFISIFVITIGYEFSQKTYKNTLVSGITRTQFIVSKYLLMLFNILILILIYFSTSIVTGIILSRPIGSNWISLLLIALKTSLLISFFISVIFGMAILLLLLTGSVIIGSVFIIVCPFLITMLNNLLDLSWLKYFDFFSAAVKISLQMISNNQLWIYMIVSLVVLLVTISFSVIIIKNVEL